MMTADEMLDKLGEVSALVHSATRRFAPATMTADFCDFVLKRLNKGDGDRTLTIYNATCLVTTSGGLAVLLVKRLTDREHDCPLIVEEFADEVIRAIGFIHQHREQLEGRRRDVEEVVRSICRQASSEGLLPDFGGIAEHQVDLHCLLTRSPAEALTLFRFDVTMTMLGHHLNLDTYTLDVDDAEDLEARFSHDILIEQRALRAQLDAQSQAIAANDR